MILLCAHCTEAMEAEGVERWLNPFNFASEISNEIR